MANKRTKLWDTETSKFQEYPPRNLKAVPLQQHYLIRQNRLNVGNNSKNIDEIFGTKVAQDYDTNSRAGYKLSARGLQQRLKPLKPPR